MSEDDVKQEKYPSEDGRAEQQGQVQGEIFIFPEYEELKNSVEKLRTELSMLVLERDELLFVECKNIEMAYMLELGGLEYKAYELHCAVRRLKRKVELIQAKKNRQEKVVLSKIEGLLDIEFAEYQEKLKEQLDKMNAAMERSRGEFLSDEETAEIRKMYRSVVKALHPDLNPGQSDAERQLFLNAVTAYENGDIAGLRVISDMVADPALPADAQGSAAQLIKEKERLTKQVQRIVERIAEIKAEYPYTMKEIVQSPDLLEVRKVELETYIKQLNETLDLYKAKIDEMLR